ncbi:MAG: DUF924 domain-containing protein [Rhizobiaceae bacterium]|nr:DUF924 domain-containing protein [Rhizobiaceae bacterium]
MVNEQVATVLEFWQAAGPSAWWKKNTDFDEQIADRFAELYEQAARRELDDWRKEANSCLALIIILDQFSRNMFRNNAKTFAQDDYALELAKHGVANGFDTKVAENIRSFYYLPYMHSEALDDQEACVELIRSANIEGSLKSAIEHRDIIARFGRFPHRNPVLGRNTSIKERAFLDEGGFSG